MKSTLNNMLPALKINDLCYSLSANTVFVGKDVMIDSLFSLLANISYYFIGKFCISGINAFRRHIEFIFKGMVAILLACSPFKIACVIMRFLSVKVVYLRIISWIINKRPSNQPVNKILSIFTPHAKQNIMIALFRFPLLENATPNGTQCAPSVRDGAVKGSYITSTRNLVFTLKATNIFPYFITHKSPPELVPNSITCNNEMQQICEVK